jgi:WhiB family redox-sensing transcriptional regulator
MSQDTDTAAAVRAIRILIRSTRGVPDWPDAACKGSDPDLFFPPPGRGASKQSATAKQVCSSCPARTACLSWALADNVHGIWGGTTEEERRVRRRQQRN